jgi:molybdenum cofactor synthesis domain-containing protein
MNPATWITIRPGACSEDGLAPLLPPIAPAEARSCFGRCHLAVERSEPLPVGTVLGEENNRHSPLFQVAGRAFVPGVSRACELLRALRPWPPAAPWAEDGEPLRLPLSRKGYAAAFITLSDKGWAGEREDRSGPRMAELLRPNLPLCFTQSFLLSDEPAPFRALVLELAAGQGYDLILCSGGTGLSPRDLAPEALLPVLSRRLPGFEQRMMQASLAETPYAILSRALAGTIGPCLVLALPGSVKGAAGNLAAVLPVLPHALEKLHGDPTECGG